jgi:hypothetical protein
MLLLKVGVTEEDVKSKIASFCIFELIKALLHSAYCQMTIPAHSPSHYTERMQDARSWSMYTYMQDVFQDITLPFVDVTCRCSHRLIIEFPNLVQPRAPATQQQGQ